MKSLNIYTFLTGLLCFFVGLITCACEKESPWELTETEDVCSMMDDPLFINLCRNYHDYNHDGLFSMQEAASITELNCMESSLTSLKGIEYFTALLKLNCDGNRLTDLDVSKNGSLTELRCNVNHLTSINISKNPALTVLSCDDNTLSSLDVSSNPALRMLYCSDNKLINLDLSSNPALTHLICDRNLLTRLDVSNNYVIIQLSCSDNLLNKLNISNNKALQSLSCYGNHLSVLDVSNNLALQPYMYCGGQNETLTVYYSAGQPYQSWMIHQQNTNVNWVLKQ